MHDIVIRGATIVDGTGAPRFEGDVAVDGRLISEVGKVEGAGRREIDARGLLVTPGFVDIHTHLGNFPFPFASTDFNHSDVSETTDPNGAHTWAEHSITVQDPAFEAALAAGVTTVQVLPGSANLFGGRGVVLHNVPAATVQAKKFPGAPISLKMACGENPKYNYGDNGRFPSSRMGNMAGYRDAFLQAGAQNLRLRGRAAQPFEADRLRPRQQRGQARVAERHEQKCRRERASAHGHAARRPDADAGHQHDDKQRRAEEDGEFGHRRRQPLLRAERSGLNRLCALPGTSLPS